MNLMEHAVFTLTFAEDMTTKLYTFAPFLCTTKLIFVVFSRINEMWSLLRNVLPQWRYADEVEKEK